MIPYEVVMIPYEVVMIPYEVAIMTYICSHSIILRGFIPSPGLLRHLATPTPSETVRIDTGVRQGRHMLRVWQVDWAVVQVCNDIHPVMYSFSVTAASNTQTLLYGSICTCA